MHKLQLGISGNFPINDFPGMKINFSSRESRWRSHQATQVLIFDSGQVREQDCISPNDPKGENYYGKTNIAGGISCMKWKDIWQPNWNSKLSHPNDGLNHNYCRNIIGSQFPQPWCMVQKPIDGPTAVQCSIPKCSQRQRQIDIFPTALPLIITSTTTSSDYGSTEGSTVRPARTTEYIASTVVTTTSRTIPFPFQRPFQKPYNLQTFASTAGYTAGYTAGNTATGGTTNGYTIPMTGKYICHEVKKYGIFTEMIYIILSLLLYGIILLIFLKLYFLVFETRTSKLLL